MSSEGESQPLIRRNNEDNAQHTNGVQDIQHQFEDALQEEAPGTTFYDILIKRPGAVIVALSLFALLICGASWISALRDPALLDKFLKVPDIKPLGAKLLEIHRHEIDTVARVGIVMDYTNLGNGSMRSIAETLGVKLGTLGLRVDNYISVSAFVEENSEEDEDSKGVWKHVIQLEVPDEYNIDLHPNSYQEIEFKGIFTEAGQSNTLGYIANRILTNQLVTFKAAGTAIASKYGLSFRLPFTIQNEFNMPEKTSEDLAEISNVEVRATKLHSLNITALMNATIGNFPMEGEFPELFWEVKIPGCNPNELEVLCQGATLPFELLGEDEVVDVLFSSIVDDFPVNLIEVCDPNKKNSLSPLDTWITSYLAGEMSTFYVHGVEREDQPSIVNELVSGFDIPYSVYGKSPTERLIQSVSLEEVRFGQGLSVLDVVRFNGKAIVDVVLPSFLKMKSKTSVVVNGVMGNIQLFDEKKNHFGQILGSNKWIQTISLAHDDGYKVICFLDNIPMEISDNSVFAGVSRQILIYGEVPIRYDAVLDIKFETSVGSLLVKKVRVKGSTEMRA